MFETICNFLAVCQDSMETAYMGTELYKTVGALLRGTEINRFERTQQTLNIRSQLMERLGDNILYAPNIYVVQDLNRLSKQQRVEELREVKMTLEPVQRAVGSEILSSAMIVAPDRMRNAMKKSPWEVLTHISPIVHPSVPSDPHLVPVLFRYDNTQFLGWQTSGILPTLFDLDYNQEMWNKTGELYLPAGLGSDQNQEEEQNQERERLNYPDGSYYMGETRNGKANGWGVKTFTDGSPPLEGRWEDDYFFSYH